MSPKEWETMITATMNDVLSGKFDYIQQIKEYRVLPTTELQYFASLDAKKRRKVNATTPIILLGQEKNVLPKFSALKHYVNKNKDKPILGLDILTGLEKDDNEWSGGTILDPRNGKIYKCYIKLVNTNKLKIRGYIGVSLFGKTAYWQRAE